MYAQDSIIVPPIQPKGVVDISVPMIAPSTPGTYQSQWRMRNERGELFGTPVWIKISGEEVVEVIDQHHKVGSKPRTRISGFH